MNSRMRWEVKEDEIVCGFYLEHQNSWRHYIQDLMDELKTAGYINRDESSTRMRVSNYAYLHTGVGLSKTCRQEEKVYNSLK